MCGCVIIHNIVWYVTFTENSDEDEYYVFTPSQPKPDDDEDDERDEYLKIVVDEEEISAFKQDHNSVEQ